MSAELDPILRQAELGPVSLANRVFVAPHTTNFAPPGTNTVTERHLAYHRERAAGGASLIITEGIRIHPTSLRRLGLQAFDDGAIPGLASLAEVVHEQGVALFAQLLHTGRHTGDERSGAWAPSALPWTTGAPVPHEVNRADIETLIASYADAARRVLQAGFDGMELHIGHGHLLQQFLSPLTNKRRDAYGGSFERRLRLPLQALDAVAAAVRGEAALGLRLSAEEFMPGGLEMEESLEIVAALRERVRLDFVHVSHSAYAGAPTLDTQMADMTFPSAPFVQYPARFKSAFPDLPVLAVCRLDDASTGAEIVASGKADMVGYARPHIADPQLLRKALGEERRPVRSCIACNQGCNGNLEQALPIACAVNPEVGLEAQWKAAWAAVPRRTRVLVVGGGPAGMEAAATAARRGHSVEVWDADRRLGGRVRDAARLRGRERFGRLAEELAAELRLAGVGIETARRAEPDELLEGGWDAVVVATGAAEAEPERIEGADFRILTPLAALADAAALGPRVVVLDELGSWLGAGLAEHVAALGPRVDLVSPLAGVAPGVTVYSRLALIERLGRLGVRSRPLRRPIRTDGGDRLVLADLVGGEEEVVEAVTALVHVRPPVASDGLVEDLRERGYGGEVHLVGDAYAPRTCQEAVFDGRAAGVAIGTPDRAPVEALLPRAHYGWSRAA